MCGSLEKRGDGDRQRDRETETDLDSRVLSDSFGAVGPKIESLPVASYGCCSIAAARRLNADMLV